jgi:glycosyltransferase involved in cell wall biosynthesis
MLDGRPVRRAVEQVLDREKVDLVLGFFNEMAYLPDLLAGRGVAFGTIATWLSYRMALDPKRMGKGLRRMLLQRGYRRCVIEPYRRASVIFANSEFTRGELIDVVGCDPARIRVNYLGVATTFFGVPRVKPAKIDRFVFFGRLVPEKGIEDALRALGKLARAGQRDWTFRVMGSGAHDHVRRVAAEEGIAAQIELSDHQGDATLKAELERAHVAILPSWSESFGLSIAEAQAAGLPVVGYLAGSVPEIVENGNTAWLVPLRDVDALARAIEASMRDPEVTYQAGLAGRERVRAMFRWEETAARVLSATTLDAPPN